MPYLMSEAGYLAVENDVAPTVLPRGPVSSQNGEIYLALFSITFPLIPTKIDPPRAYTVVREGFDHWPVALLDLLVFRASVG
jgi:hypothetical protein